MALPGCRGSAGTVSGLSRSAGTQYRTVPAHFKPWLSLKDATSNRHHCHRYHWFAHLGISILMPSLNNRAPVATQCYRLDQDYVRLENWRWS